MTRWKTVALVAILVLIAAKVGYDSGTSSAVERVGLVEYHFRVVDAESGEAIPSYSFTFPNTRFLNNGNRSAFPRYSSHRKGDDFSIFYTVSDEPVQMVIGADGYADHAVTLNLDSSYSSGSGPLPIDLATISLKKTAQQIGAPNP